MSTQSAVRSDSVGPFTVVAGKFEADDIGRITVNYKYIESFFDIDHALAALRSVNDYPYAAVEYGGVALKLIPLASEIA